MAVRNRNHQDGGEAILEAFRRLGVKYIMSSPGSEMSPVWEAMARQDASGTAGPKLIESWHETVAVDMALGYTAYTGEMQAVLLHAGVGVLQGSMALLSATASETPMIVMSGESAGLGEAGDLEIEPQWYGGVSVGGADRFVQPIVKRAMSVVHPDTLYENVIRAGELAQREQKGPVFLGLTLEVLLDEWRRPETLRAIPPAPKLRPLARDIEDVAALVAAARNPVIVAETAGRDPAAFHALLALAEAHAIPVYGARSAVTYASFPTGHELWQGFFKHDDLADADLILLVGGRLPWYPPSRRPGSGRIVSIAETPIKRHLVYQTLMADHYLEGDLATVLGELAQAVRPAEPERARIAERRTRWARKHRALEDALARTAKAARELPGINAVALASVAAEVFPPDTIYVDETITHMGAMRPHLPLDQPQSFFRATGGGLGQGIAISLGLKLGAGDRPVVLFVGDGSLLYNPIVQALGASRKHALPIIIVVCNNAKYATMGTGHLRYYPDGVAAKSKLHYGVEIDGPEYQDLGSHFGFHGAKADNMADLGRALKEALAAVRSGRTSIVNVVMAE